MAEMNFSDLGAVISMLGSNPEMLKMLSGLMSAGAPAPKPESPPKAAPNGDALASIMSMLGASKSSDGSTRETPNVTKPPNPLSVFGTSEEIKNRIALLRAVRPYLSEARRERLETVIKLLRVAELGGLGSLLGEFK